MLIKTVSYERCEFGMRNNTLPKHYENGQIAAIITAELVSPIVLSKPTVSLVSLGGEGVQYSNKTPIGGWILCFWYAHNFFKFWSTKWRSSSQLSETVIENLLRQILSEINSVNLSRSTWLTVDELSAYLGLKPNTIYQYVHENRIPYHKIPGSSKLLFARKEVDA